MTLCILKELRRVRVTASIDGCMMICDSLPVLYATSATLEGSNVATMYHTDMTMEPIALKIVLLPPGLDLNEEKKVRAMHYTA
mgnify:CR=1 FL=1